MNDYISREEVLKKFFERGSGYINVLTSRDMINKIPAADVQPVKHGRWIDIYEYCEERDLRPTGLGVYYWCSECGEAEKKTSDFCPNCGARMDLKED